MEKAGEEICSAISPSKLNVVGDWIYYVGRENEAVGGESIYRIKADGSNQERLYSNADYVYQAMVATTNQIFFQVSSSYEQGTRGEIFSMNLDGSDMKTFVEGMNLLYGIDNNFLYYGDLNGERPRLCRTNLKKEEQDVLINDFMGAGITLEDGWIYYTGYTESIDEDSLLVFRFNIETGNTESVQVIDLIDYEMGSMLCVKDGYLYYFERESGNIMKANVDRTGEPLKIGNGEPYDLLYACTLGIVKCSDPEREWSVIERVEK